MPAIMCRARRCGRTCRRPDGPAGCLRPGPRQRAMQQMNVPPALPILLLAAAGFLSSAGARVIDPLLSVIAADFGTTVPAVSIVVAAFTLPYGLCQVLIGPAGDRLGKLRVVFWALLAFAAATGACAL